MVFPPLWDETENPETPRDPAELSMKMGARVKQKKRSRQNARAKTEVIILTKGFFGGVIFLPIS